MFKGQKTLAALAVSLLFTSPVFAADEGSGEIHFKGEVLEAPCEIAPEDLDMTIDLGEVTTYRMNEDHHSDKKPVDIHLINCRAGSTNDGTGVALSRVVVKFDGTSKTTGAEPLLANTTVGGATGVGVRLMNKDDSPIVLGTDSKETLLPRGIDAQLTLNFFAWMEQIDAGNGVTPGAVTAEATYILDYQ